MRILRLENKDDEKVLRTKTKPFDFEGHTRRDIELLVKKMREAMNRADGVGLAANQIGLDHKVFVAQWDGKFYAIFNPYIESKSREKEPMDEGCLSIPGKFGEVDRPAKVTLVGQNKQGKEVKIKAWGVLSAIFQHEVDHLDGKLFVDRMKRKAQLKG